MRLTLQKNIALAVYIVSFCTFIFPTGLIAEGNYTIPKMIFVGTIGILYLLMKISSKKISRFEAVFICLITALTIITRNINYLLFITLCYLEEIAKYKKDIVDCLNNSKVLYICLAFTILYTFCFIGSNDSRGRYAFTAIKEINQSGLAIFCLGIMLLNKNKKVGYFTLVFGCLTFSRSYYLALLCLIIYNFGKKYFSIKEKTIKLFNYINLTLVSSILLILLGFFYINQYKSGNIILGGNNSTRLVNFLDYSNFFRFQATIVLLRIFLSYPKDVIFGISNEKYVELGHKISSKMKLPFRDTPPHNLFFSHLKIYGLFTFIEVYYVSRILKNIVSVRNAGIYIGIVLYSIFLGAGLYSYWLYLSLFCLVYYDDYCNNNDDNKKIQGYMKD